MTMLDNYLSVHANAIKLRSQRTQLLATNIANADTPNYKARDLAFAEVLRDVKAPGMPAALNRRKMQLSGGELNVTDSRHIKIRKVGMDAKLMYREPEKASLDGNTVDKDMEQARFAENAIRYQASLEFIKSRVGSLMRALRTES